LAPRLFFLNFYFGQPHVVHSLAKQAIHRHVAIYESDEKERGLDCQLWASWSEQKSTSHW